MPQIKSQDRQLRSIKNIAQFKAEDAAKILAEVMAKKAQAEQRLVELIAYRQEYEHKLKLNYSRQGAPVEQMRQGRLFINRLSDAIYQQQENIRRVVEDLEKKLEFWRKSHADHKALDTLLDKYALAERVKQERRTQAETEDVVYSRLPRNRGL